jgi:hypothetical protein
MSLPDSAQGIQKSTLGKAIHVVNFIHFHLQNRHFQEAIKHSILLGNIGRNWFNAQSNVSCKIKRLPPDPMA